MANADTAVANTFTAAQTVLTVDYTTVTTTTDGFGNQTFNYAVGNIFRIQLDHTIHNVTTPYIVPVPTGMPNGYVWTIILIQDASVGAVVRFPIMGPSNTAAILFQTGVPVTYGTNPAQITLLSSIYDSTVSSFMGSFPMIYG